MKKIYFVLSLVFLTSMSVLSQNSPGLNFRNYSSNSTKFVQEGSKVRGIINGKIYKGNLKIISDQSICINSDTIQLDQIQEISAKSVSRQIGGTALIIPSGLLGGSGLALVGAGLASADGYGILGVIFGVPVAAVGILGVYLGIKLIKGKKFSPSRWEYRIANPASVVISN
ncbi:MAG: hypothetical protein Q8S54_00010 [Bacteroidota bacterium]|nr:hypothetical protein [Odoribacter sp.]MDP3641553.1 hypothetical protein [Bacteroidota bacterium]